jgi:hypothetical protein
MIKALLDLALFGLALKSQVISFILPMHQNVVNWLSSQLLMRVI